MAKLKKIPDDDYEIVDRGEENFHHILLKGDSPFAGVLYQYGKVNLVEEEDQLRVKFEYEVFENKRQIDTKSAVFVEYIGQILVVNLEEILIYNKFQKGQYKSGD